MTNINILRREETIALPEWGELCLHMELHFQEASICQFMRDKLVWHFRLAYWAEDYKLLIQCLHVGETTNTTVIEARATEENYQTACDIVEKIFNGKIK